MTCETCKFSKKYTEPTGDGKLYKEVNHRHPIFFWKILETTTEQRDPSDLGLETDFGAYFAMKAHKNEIYRYEYHRICSRFPEKAKVRKEYQCGEFIEALD